jgi:hypothetical protein
MSLFHNVSFLSYDDSLIYSSIIIVLPISVTSDGSMILWH